jgi:hypothetical protein
VNSKSFPSAAPLCSQIFFAAPEQMLPSRCFETKFLGIKPRLLYLKMGWYPSKISKCALTLRAPPKICRVPTQTAVTDRTVSFSQITCRVSRPRSRAAHPDRSHRAGCMYTVAERCNSSRSTGRALHGRALHQLLTEYRSRTASHRITPATGPTHATRVVLSVPSDVSYRGESAS